MHLPAYSNWRQEEEGDILQGQLHPLVHTGYAHVQMFSFYRQNHHSASRSQVYEHSHSFSQTKSYSTGSKIIRLQPRKNWSPSAPHAPRTPVQEEGCSIHLAPKHLDTAQHREGVGGFAPVLPLLPSSRLGAEMKRLLCPFPSLGQVQRIFPHCSIPQEEWSRHWLPIPFPDGDQPCLRNAGRAQESGSCRLNVCMPPLPERVLSMEISQKCPPVEMNICSRPLVFAAPLHVDTHLQGCLRAVHAIPVLLLF